MVVLRICKKEKFISAEVEVNSVNVQISYTFTDYNQLDNAIYDRKYEMQRLLWVDMIAHLCS